jgi:hypothetical protein
MNAHYFAETVAYDDHPLTRDCLTAFIVVFGGDLRAVCTSPLFKEWSPESQDVFRHFSHEIGLMA